MKKIIIFLSLLLIASLAVNMYLFSALHLANINDAKKLEVFTRVADDLDSCRSKSVPIVRSN
jgi:hypothetical protein